MFELHKASFSKRFGAGTFDLILLSILAIGLVLVIHWVTGFDNHSQKYEEALNYYQTKYNVTFDIQEETYNSLSESERQNWDKAYEALTSDVTAMTEYNIMITTIYLSVALGILLSYLILEFIVPLCFGNGMTIGKKLFSISLMSVNGVKVGKVQLFVRTMFGKYVVETMVPVCLIVMFFLNITTGLSLIIIAALGLLQAAIFLFTRDKKLIHDVFAQTVVVDYSTQTIYETYDALIKAKEDYYAKKANETEY